MVRKNFGHDCKIIKVHLLSAYIYANDIDRQTFREKAF